VRTAVIGAAGAALLALAPPASAAFKPLLTATSSGDTVTLGYSQAAANDGTAMLTFYAPGAYGAKLPTAVGSAVGVATGSAVAADIRGSTLPLSGTIRVASPAAPLGATTVGDAARACAGAPTLATVWSLTLDVFNVTVPLAIGVQRIDAGPMAGSIAFSVCPPPAGVPAGTPGRAPLGLKVVHLTLRLTNAFAVPQGTHVWHLKATPFAPGTGQPNAAAAAEAEAEHAAPPRLTLAAKGSTVSGRLTVAGKGVGGRTILISAGGKQVGRATTSATGAFSATVALKRVPATLTAKVVVPARYLACASPAFAPLPCTTSIVSGFAASAHARVVR
jgi:hypothetical protein